MLRDLDKAELSYTSYNLYKQYKLYTAYSLYGLIGGRIQLLEPFSSYTLQDLNSMSLKTMEDFEISIRYSGL